ncbi:MAG TPA: Ig-like domain-containing protein, partial [Alcaligenes sp.]|nr:Ig-like domain-containing protein [Alcaligenes sp.]
TRLPVNGFLTYTDEHNVTRQVTQQDIDNKTVFKVRADGSSGLKYSHDGKENTADSFDIKTIDNRGAESGLARVNIEIVGTNDGPRIPGPGQLGSGGTADYNDGNNQASTPAGDNQGRNKPVTVDEGGSIQIGSGNLHAYDPDSSARQVQYTITEKPAQGRLYYKGADGSITYLDVGSSFTQDDVNNGRIHYAHMGREVPANQSGPIDRFVFTLADGAKELPGTEFHIYSRPTNDAPTVSLPGGPIRVTDADNPTPVPGISVGDKDLNDGGQLVEDFVQVVVRLQDSNGTPITDYTGVTLALGAGSSLIVAGRDGNGTYLVLQGKLADVNNALSTLSVKFDGDQNKAYKLEIIADDRLRNEQGQLTGKANGGDINQPGTPTLPPKPIDGNNYNWAADAVPTGSENISSRTVDLWASRDNNPSTITLPPAPTEVYEDVGYEFSAEKDRIVITDVESTTFGSEMRLTLEAGNGTLSFKNTSGARLISDSNGKYVFQGSHAQLQAMLDAGVTFKGQANYHGPASLTVSVQEDNTQLADSASANVVSESIAFTVIPVNDKPGITIGGKVDLGGNGFVGLNIGGIADTSDIQGTANNTNLQVRVVVRFTDAHGTVVTSHDGQDIQFRLGTDDSTVENGFVELFGTIEQINAKLASLQAKFSGDANATYKLQVIVDDRNHQVDPGTNTGTLTGGANGGLVNPDSNSPNGVSTVDSSRTWQATDSTLPGLFNIHQATKDINVSGTNDKPTIVGNGPITVTEDTATLVKDTNGQFLQIADTDDFGSQFTVELSATQGTLSFANVTGSLPQTKDGVQIAKVGDTYKLVGNKTNINALLKNLQFQANADLHTDPAKPNGLGASISMKVTDTALPGSGTAGVEQQSFEVRVSSQNDRPTISKDVSLDPVAEDTTSTPKTIKDLDFGYSDARDDQSAANGGNTSTDFSYIAIVGSDGYDASQGQWQIQDGGSWITIPTAGLGNNTALIFNSSAQIRFVPAANFHGEPGKLIIRAGDGSSTMVTSNSANARYQLGLGPTTSWSNETHKIGITVTSVNDAPVAQPDTNTVLPGATTDTANVLTGKNGQGIDSDVDGDTLTVTGVVTGKATDINAVTGTVGSGNVGSALTGTYGTLTLNPDGTYTYTANNDDTLRALKAGEKVEDVFSYAISDGNGGVDYTTLTITINGQNDAPDTVGTLPDKTGVDASAIVDIPTAGGFKDVDPGDTLTYSATGLPSGLTIDTATGIISGTPDKDASQGGTDGVYTITVTANDGKGGTVDQTFKITITNPGPGAVADTNTVNAGQSTGIENVITGKGGAGIDTDPDGDALTVTGVITGTATDINAVTGTVGSGNVGSA